MKKTLNKFLKLFLLVVTCFSTFITANAETAPASLSVTSHNIGSEPIPFPSSQYNGYAHYIVKKTSDGKYVYCVYYSKKSPNTGVGYSKSSLVTDAIPLFGVVVSSADTGIITLVHNIIDTSRIEISFFTIFSS